MRLPCAFQEFEREVDTTEFVLGDVSMWHIIRAGIVGKLVYEVPYTSCSAAKGKQQKSPKSTLRDLGSQLQHSLLDLGRQLPWPGKQWEADFVAMTTPRRRNLFRNAYGIGSVTRIT
jgi:hypothetical protein